MAQGLANLTNHEKLMYMEENREGSWQALVIMQ